LQDYCEKLRVGGCICRGQVPDCQKIQKPLYINTFGRKKQKGGSDLDSKLYILKEIVNKQAKDCNLWFIAKRVTEEMLQRALRELHALIENSSDRKSLDKIKDFAIKQRDNESEECELFFIPEWESERILQNALQELYETMEIGKVYVVH
jgi:hypothetical protein